MTEKNYTKVFECDPKYVNELFKLAKNSGIPVDAIWKHPFSNKIECRNEYASKISNLLEKASKRIELGKK